MPDTAPDLFDVQTSSTWETVYSGTIDHCRDYITQQRVQYKSDRAYLIIDAEYRDGTKRTIERWTQRSSMLPSEVNHRFEGDPVHDQFFKIKATYG